MYLDTRDGRVFDELYERYAGKIYGRCISILYDEAESQDAVQDIFMKILGNLSKFNFKSKFSTWVYSITYNWCIDLIRKRKKRAVVDDADGLGDLDVIDEVDDSFLLETEISRLKLILEKIPADDKAVLLMKYLEEMSIKEMTEVLEKSESAVKMQIKRAKHRFRLIYDRHYKGK